MSHWSVKYIGLPFSPGARGPAEVDCWGLVFLIYANEFKIGLHPLPGSNVLVCNPRDIDSVISKEVAEEWREIPRPADGCVVAMGRSKILHHVGLYAAADGGRVVHAKEGQNVIADTLRNLRLQGMRILKFYQHNQWPG